MRIVRLRCRSVSFELFSSKLLIVIFTKCNKASEVKASPLLEVVILVFIFSQFYTIIAQVDKFYEVSNYSQNENIKSQRDLITS